MDWSSKSWSETVVKNSKFSVDLKLGRLEDVGVMSMKNSGDLPLNMAASNSSSSSVKRGRVSHGRAQSCASCLVDECIADLSDCREYYRRHRVCERHSKTPVVVIGGLQKRFCQQCSRFQSLGEFDEVKRSCRKRLEGHNRRRRKSQPETFYMTSAGLQSSQIQTGNKLGQFWSASQTNTPNRPVISQLEEKTSHYGHHHHHHHHHHHEHQTGLPDSLSWSTKGDKHYTLLSDMMSHQTVHQQRLLNDTTTASMGITRDRLTHQSVSVQSECVLSLLSTYPTRTQSSGGTYTGQISMQPPMMTLTSSSAEGIGVATALHLEDESLVSLSSSTSNNNNAHSFGGFQQSGQIGFCENGSSRIFPFAWE